MISIIIPIVRPIKASRCISMISKAVDHSDYEVIAEHDRDGIGCPRMVKNMVAKSKGDYVCFLGDDTLPQPGFLTEAMKVMFNFADGWGLVGFNDRTGRRLPTHWVASKKLLKYLDGEFFHTGYTHCFADNELMLRCEVMGRYMYSLRGVVEHEHPVLSKDDSLLDEHYRRVYDKKVQDKDKELFASRIDKFL